MNRRTKNVTATVHVSFSSLLVLSFFLFNVYRIIEYVYLRLMLSVMDQSTEPNQTRRRAGRVCVCVCFPMCVMGTLCLIVLQGHSMNLGFFLSQVWEN